MRAIDLFSGFGGLSLGAASAGVRNVHGIDADAVAVESLLANRNVFHSLGCNLQAIVGDVGALHELYQANQNLDLVLAGPPCQPFSISGRWKGKNDVRDGLRSAVGSISTMLPKCFVVENVFGLGSVRHSNYLSAVIRGLEYPDLLKMSYAGGHLHVRLPSCKQTKGQVKTYDVKSAILNAADYGLPQNRKRIFLVGVRTDLRAKEYTFPRPTHSMGRLIYDQFETGVYWDAFGISPPSYYRAWLRERRLVRRCDEFAINETQRWKTLRDIQCEHDLSDPWTVPRAGAKAYSKHCGAPLDWPSKTIKAGVHGVPGGENIVQLGKDRFRYLSLRECSICQGFPRPYWAPSSFSRSMRLIGNAVPVLLATEVVKKLPIFRV